MVKVYNYAAVIIEGKCIYFDGKGDTDKKELRIYNIYGDASLYSRAIDTVCKFEGYTSHTFVGTN